MKYVGLIHFAWHGIQDTDHPAGGGHCPTDKCPLKLSDIVSLSYSRCELVFLSAWYTAMGDEDLYDPEGMLFAGYGGVNWGC